VEGRSGIRAMRAVSFFGLDEGAPDKIATGTGAWKAGDGFVEDGGGAGGRGKASGEVST
jgi:hypothetical protein